MSSLKEIGDQLLKDYDSFTPKRRPLIGIMPRYIWLEERTDELVAAVIRYARNRYEVPIEWIIEYNKNLKELNNDNHPKE